MEQEIGTRPLIRTLPNGVRLLALPMPHVRSVSVGVFLRVGSRDETPATNGISHVLEHMAFKGTTTRSVQAINLDAERLGADVNAYTGKDSTGYFMTGLGEHAQQLLDVTARHVSEAALAQFTRVGASASRHWAAHARSEAAAAPRNAAATSRVRRPAALPAGACSHRD